MSKALLLDCSELALPKPSGTSLMPQSGVNIGNAVNGTSVGSIFFTCARNNPSSEEYSGDTIPAWTEGIPNKHTRKNLSVSLAERLYLTVMANSQLWEDTGLPQQIPDHLHVKKQKKSSAVSWHMISVLKKQIYYHDTEHVYIWAICERKQALLNQSVALKNLCILGNWWKRASRIS